MNYDTYPIHIGVYIHDYISSTPDVTKLRQLCKPKAIQTPRVTFNIMWLAEPLTEIKTRKDMYLGIF